MTRTSHLSCIESQLLQGTNQQMAGMLFSSCVVTDARSYITINNTTVELLLDRAAACFKI